MKYDFLIVGAGLFGSTFARLATDKGYKCFIIDKRSHIAGNCYTENVDNINVHKYGPHIFHTNNDDIWNFVNQFSEFNNYEHRIKACNNGTLYSFPINLATFNELWCINTASEAQQKLEEVRIRNDNPQNLEEWILDKVGERLYNTFIKEYTAKQWNKDPKDLPSFIIKRIPIRLTFNDNYFNDEYQGIPIGGYTKLFERMLEGIPIALETDYFADRDHYDGMAKKVIYTGAIDEFFNYTFGEMEWRSLRFESNHFKNRDYQGYAIVNYTSKDVDYTRIIEHKHFENPKIENTIITKEYPQDYERGLDKFYPINTDQNEYMLQKYRELINHDKYLFGGRLAEYKYYDMHQVIGSAMKRFKSFV